MEDLFQEPDDFYDQSRERESIVRYHRHGRDDENGDGSNVIVLRLIPAHSLWGHCLWNGAQVLADMIEGRIIPTGY